MKVKEVMKKFNYAAAEIPVFLQEGASGTKRMAVSWDYGNYYFDEQDYTVTSISLKKDEVVIHYKMRF